MTNNEAINILTQARLNFLNNQFVYLDTFEVEAIDVALRALEQIENDKKPNYNQGWITSTW